MNIKNANSHPFQVEIVGADENDFYANSHPYKVAVVGGHIGIEGRVVEELPQEGETGYIYLVLKETTSEGDIYDEYMWTLQQDGETYAWEHLGATNEITLEIDDQMSDTSENAVQNKVIKDYVDTGLSGKQGVLTAGDGIDITNDVIKATNTGKARELTTDDYNYPIDNPTYVALWLLEPGVYWRASTNVEVRWKIATAGGTDMTNARLFIISGDITTSHPMMAIGGSIVKTTVLSANGGGTADYPKTYVREDSIVDNLTSTSTIAPLSANQGKVLKDLVDSLAIRGTGAPTTSTVGQVGTLYEDTTNGDLYICTDATNPYVWEEVGAGGGGPTVVQTTGTSTTDVMSQNAVTSMMFADPSTRQRIQIGANANASGCNSVAVGGLNTNATNTGSVALGEQARATAQASVAFAYGAATTQGEFNIGTGDSWSSGGYNNSAYRLLTGLYDGQSAHDAVNKGQLDTAIINGGTTAPTTATVGAVGTLYSYVDTTGATPEPHMMVCTVADTVTPSYTWVEIGGGGSVATINSTDWNNLWQ